MKYYLKKTQAFYYDGHGTPDNGEILKEVVEDYENSGITEDGIYIFADDYFNYLGRMGSEIDVDDTPEVDYFLIPDDYEDVMEYYAEDGYNCIRDTYEFKEISILQADEYSDIINDYNKL